jgi:hypothetical protein
MEAFWVDAAVRHAGVQFENERRKEAEQSHGKAGTASPSEKDELHDNQEQRARLRESMEQAGQLAPDPDGQMDALEELREMRQGETE